MTDNRAQTQHCYTASLSPIRIYDAETRASARALFPFPSMRPLSFHPLPLPSMCMRPHRMPSHFSAFSPMCPPSMYAAGSTPTSARRHRAPQGEPHPLRRRRGAPRQRWHPWGRPRRLEWPTPPLPAPAAAAVVTRARGRSGAYTRAAGNGGGGGISGGRRDQRRNIAAAAAASGRER